MSKQRARGFYVKWSELDTSAKAAVITIASIVLVGGITLPVYLNYQNQQALILAEQQEQELLAAAELAEAERITTEEQAKLEQETQAEADRLVAEKEAARLKAKRLEQERIEAEAEQARLEAEVQAEAERIAAEEATVAEQTRQQAEAVANQATSNNSSTQNTGDASEASNSGNRGSKTQKQYVQEPTSGEAYEMANRMGGVWIPEMEGWVYIGKTGSRVLIHYYGGTEVISTGEAAEASNSDGSDSGARKRYIEEPTSGEAYEMAQRMGAIWIPELEGWAYISVVGEYVLIRYTGATRSLDGAEENLAIAKRYLG